MKTLGNCKWLNFPIEYVDAFVAVLRVVALKLSETFRPQQMNNKIISVPHYKHSISHIAWKDYMFIMLMGTNRQVLICVIDFF